LQSETQAVTVKLESRTDATYETTSFKHCDDESTAAVALQKKTFFSFLALLG